MVGASPTASGVGTGSPGARSSAQALNASSSVKNRRTRVCARPAPTSGSSSGPAGTVTVARARATGICAAIFSTFCRDRPGSRAAARCASMSRKRGGSSPSPSSAAPSSLRVRHLMGRSQCSSPLRRSARSMRRTRPGASLPRDRPQSSARRAPTGSLLGAGWSPPACSAASSSDSRARSSSPNEANSQPADSAWRQDSGWPSRAAQRAISRSTAAPCSRSPNSTQASAAPPRCVSATTSSPEAELRRAARCSPDASRRSGARASISAKPAAAGGPASPVAWAELLTASSWSAATRCPAGPAALSTTTPDDPPPPP